MKLWLLAILIVGIAINNLSFAKPIKETGKFSVYIDSNPGYIIGGHYIKWYNGYTLTRILNSVSRVRWETG